MVRTGGKNIKQALNSIVEKNSCTDKFFPFVTFLGKCEAQETDRQMNHESILGKIVPFTSPANS